VKLDVEGQTLEIEAFINMIGERMHGFIRKTERDAERRERRFSEFRIK
jgi:acylphosphatase